MQGMCSRRHLRAALAAPLARAAEALVELAVAAVWCVAIQVPVLARGGAVCAMDLAASQTGPDDARGVVDGHQR